MHMTYMCYILGLHEHWKPLQPYQHSILLHVPVTSILCSCVTVNMWLFSSGGGLRVIWQAASWAARCLVTALCRFNWWWIGDKILIESGSSTVTLLFKHLLWSEWDKWSQRHIFLHFVFMKVACLKTICSIHWWRSGWLDFVSSCHWVRLVWQQTQKPCPSTVSLPRQQYYFPYSGHFDNLWWGRLPLVKSKDTSASCSVFCCGWQCWCPSACPCEESLFAHTRAFSVVWILQLFCTFALSFVLIFTICLDISLSRVPCCWEDRRSWWGPLTFCM